MVAGCVLLVILMMKLFPELPFARVLHHVLVEAPLRKLAEMSRRHLIYAAVLIWMTFTGTELLLLLGSTDMLTLFAWDVSLYVDALLATWTLSAVVRGKAAWHAFAARCVGPLRRGTRPRAPRPRGVASRTAANDSSEDGDAWRYARVV